MPSAAQTIERLSRDELTSPAYRKFASDAFGAANWDAHVRYYRWLYDENPARWSDERLPIYVCRDGAGVIGQFAMMPAAAYLDGTLLPAVWGFDFYVLPAHRRKQFGERVLALWQLDYALVLSLGQNDAGYQWTRKHGYQEGGRLTRCKLWLRPVHCGLKKALETARLGWAVRRLVGVPTLGAVASLPGVQIDPITSFVGVVGEQHDLRAGRPTRIGRTIAFMEWRYCRHPSFRYAVRRLKIEEHGDAYAVWRLTTDGLWRRASLVDFVYPDDWPQPVLERAIAAVLNCVRAEGAEVLICETSDTAVIAALRKAPFSITEPGSRFVFRVSTGRSFAIASAEQWRFYAGDCDIDSYLTRRVRT